MWSLTCPSAISFPSRTTQYSPSLLMGYDYRSFTALVGCGQASAWREYNDPLLHSQTIPLWIHPWIISSSLKSISSACFTDISHSNLSLTSFPPNQAPFQLHAQARHLGVDLTAPPNHSQILVLPPNIPGIHFLPPVIPVPSPNQSHQAADRSHHSASPFHGSHGFWDKDTTSHHGRLGLTRGGPCRRPSLTYNVPSAAAVPSARCTPPASPYLLPSSCPLSLQLSNQRSPQGGFP